MASFIELIAKIKQKNNGTFKLVDAQDVECEDGKGLDEVLNEKLDKNLGAENSDKVLITDAEGNIITQNKEDFEGGGTSDYNDLENKPQINGVELKGNVTSEQLGIIAKNDNFIYKDVPKQLNPNVTDSFQRAMWNLKLYGQSTQGADPSPTNPQEITAISEFEGNIRDSFQLFDKSKIKNQSVGGVNISVENDGIHLNGTTTASTSFRYEIKGNEEIKKLFKVGNLNVKRYLEPSNQTVLLTIYLYNDSVSLGSTQEGNPFLITEDILNQINKVSFFFFITASQTLNCVINPMVYQDGDGTWQPFDSNPQEFTYTPTNPMYSTQDGSIADYVDVEKGVEVYNMKPITFNNTQMSIVSYIGSTTSGYSKFTFRLPYNYVIDRKINTIISFSALEGTQEAWYTDKINIISGDNSSKDIYYANVDGSITTKEDFLALFENDVELVYILETPTETPIDPEQLAMLRALYTYNGVTNFLCNAPVSFDYEQSLQIVIQNIWNAIGQTNANILLNGGNQ